VFGFPDAPPTAAILIVESFGPGALVAVDDASDPGHMVGLWTRGEDHVVSDPTHVLRIDLASPRPLSALRIVRDTRRVEGFNEIDAVGLVAMP